ncbi:MAG TPA: PASTA domain-containing protein [Syntrophorhabdaceae bacterium]|nr:PASTA domain-containing protein [Syntrophorhabdaceae bacterium]
MNKKAKRRAFFICLAICLMNLSLAIKITERFNIKRISDQVHHEASGLSIVAAKTQEGKQNDLIEEKKGEIKEVQAVEVKKSIEAKDIKVSLKNEDNEIEPMFFITVPIVCHMIKNKVLDRDVLIPSSNNTWKKPFQILKDKDREGIKNISNMIGKGVLTRFLKKEDIIYKEGLDAEALISGIGYVVSKDRLIGIFNKNVDESWYGLFPYMVDKFVIVKAEKGFEFSEAKSSGILDKRDTINDVQWIMPDLKNLPIRDAIEQLNAKTAKIKVLGSGFVIDQSPKPREIVKGDGECIIYGRMNN